MTINIIGAGLAGLLAANLLSHRKPVVIEKQTSLPNNHSAVLRFRSSIVGDALNIPFRKVTMIKDTAKWLNPVADALAYSNKNTGVLRSDRSVIKGLEVGERWIAPPDLIKRMADRATIQFNFELDISAIAIPTISTIPMPALMKVLDYKDVPEFNSQSGVNIRATITDCEAYVSLVVPDPTKPFSRLSITGNELIIEIPRADESHVANAAFINETVEMARRFLGLNAHRITNVNATIQRYAKIVPIDDNARKAFMHWATDQHNIFSLGRFATWRPGLLLDDLVQDIRLIDRWLDGDRYAVARHR